MAFLVASTLGIWSGCYAATHRDGPGSRRHVGRDRAISVPTFVAGPLAILLFALVVRFSRSAVSMVSGA